MQSSTSRRSIATVIALSLAGPLAAFSFPAAARTVSGQETSQIETTDQDAAVVVTGSGVLNAECANTAIDHAIEARHDNFTVRIDDGGQVRLVNNGTVCAANSAAILLNSGFGGTLTVNGQLAAGDGAAALRIGDFLGNNDDKTVTVTIGATGTVTGDIILGGNDSVALTNNGTITGTLNIAHNGGTPAVTLINNGTMTAGAGTLIQDTSSGAAGTTIINNVGTFDANGTLDTTVGVMTGDLNLNGSERVYSVTNSGTYTGHISFATAGTFGGATISNSGVMKAATDTVLTVSDLGDDTTFLTLSNSFLGEITGNLNFGNSGHHTLSNSGNITGIVTFGDGDNTATLSGGFVRAATGAFTSPLFSLGDGADTVALSGSRIEAQAGFITEVTNTDGNITGFTFGNQADIQAGTLIDLGSGDDTTTISGGAIGGADTLIDMGSGDDTLTMSLNPFIVFDIDERSTITGGADTDTLAFNVAAHEDGFDFTDLAKFADFESLHVTAGTLRLNPTANNLFGVSGGTLTVNAGATLDIVDSANLNSAFGTGDITGTFRLQKTTNLIDANGTFTINAGGQLEVALASLTDHGQLASNGGGTTLDIAQGGTVELAIADPAATGFTTINQTATITIALADTITVADLGTALVDVDPFHEITLIDPTTTPGQLQVTIGRAPGFQQIGINNGQAGLLGNIGAALDSEFAACTTAERAGPVDTLCGFVADLGVTTKSNAEILQQLALAAPDRTSGEHTMRVDTQRMLHSIVEKRANILRSRSRALPAGVGTGETDRPQQQSRLSAADRQIAGLSDNLTDEIDGTGAGDLIDFGTGLGAGSVWSAHHLWMQVYTGFTERDRNGLQAGYDGDQYGMAIGYDWRASRTWLFGFYGGYAISEVDGNDRSNEQVDIDTISGGAYMSWFDRYTSWSTTLSFGISDFEGTRTGLGGNTNSRSHDGFEIGLSSSVDQNITVAKRLILTPAFDLSFGLFDRDGYTETGAFGLTVDSKTSYSLNTGLSAKLAAPGRIGRTGVLPFIRTGVWHEFLDDNNDTTANFTGSKAGASFSVDAIDTASTQFLAGLGLDMVSPRGAVNFSFGYNFVGGDDTISHNLNSNLRFRF